MPNRSNMSDLYFYGMPDTSIDSTNLYILHQSTIVNHPQQQLDKICILLQTDPLGTSTYNASVTKNVILIKTVICGTHLAYQEK